MAVESNKSVPKVCVKPEPTVSLDAIIQPVWEVNKKLAKEAFKTGL